jgi:hypothetical protein
VRMFALRGLRAARDSSAIPAIEPLRDDPDPDVRRMARRPGRLGGPRTPVASGHAARSAAEPLDPRRQGRPRGWLRAR